MVTGLRGRPAGEALVVAAAAAAGRRPGRRCSRRWTRTPTRWPDAIADGRACDADGGQATASCSWASRCSDSISPRRTWAR